MRTRTTLKLRDLRGLRELPSRRPAGPGVKTTAVTADARPASHLPLRLLWLLDSLPMRAGRRLATRLLTHTAELAFYCGIAAAIGLSSAWVMVDAGSALTVERDGPWQRWVKAGAADADPYTIAHFSRAGWLPLNGQTESYYTAARDSSGEALYADCQYTVSGPIPAARRWTLSALDVTGASIDAGAGLPAITSDTAMPGPGGSVAINVSQTASPGNWLALSGAARMELRLTLEAASQTAAVQATAAGPARRMFSIVRTGCR